MEEIKAILDKINGLKIPQDKVLLKEIGDYLIEKRNNGELSVGKVVFKDEGELDYFTKLLEKLSNEASALLKDSFGVSF